MIKVLIVDDSAIIRAVLQRELSKIQSIEVVGTASDPYVARDKIIKLNPDVITMDIEMPKMDGISFVRKLMAHYPVPVIIFSSLSERNSEIALRALDIGAVDVMQKPGYSKNIQQVIPELVLKIKAASKITMHRKPPERTPSKGDSENMQRKVVSGSFNALKRIAIGASTGGTEAIKEVLMGMPANCPPIVVVQHMPEVFTKSFAERLNTITRLNVFEAKNGDYLEAGKVLIAPGDFHMEILSSGNKQYVKLNRNERIHYQRPSVDVMFKSIAGNLRCENWVGVLLTGMGADGAEGLLDMKTSGAYAIIQDEASCVVFGMPGEAKKIGAYNEMLNLRKISERVLDYCSVN